MEQIITPITLRSCWEQRLRVTAYCASCRVGRPVVLELVAAGRFGETPIGDLVREGRFRCRDPQCRDLANFVGVNRGVGGLADEVAAWDQAGPV